MHEIYHKEDHDSIRFYQQLILFLFRIKQGYEDAKEQHQQLVARGLRPLPNAPLTPWSDARFCEMRKPKCTGGHASFVYENQCLGQNGRVYLQASMRRICHLWAHSNLVLVLRYSFWKLTWQWIIHYLKMYVLSLKWGFSIAMVNFRGCTGVLTLPNFTNRSLWTICWGAPQ